MKRKTITITTASGPRPIEAHVLDGGMLAIHLNFLGYGWTLTHVQTGLAFGPKDNTKKEAEACAARIMATGVDLNFKSEAEIMKRRKDKAKLRAAIYGTQTKKK